MIYIIGKQRLQIPEADAKGKNRTPQQSVPWRDVAESCRTLDAICRQIPEPVTKVTDGIAKVGFWAGVFRNIWPDCELVLNETSQPANQVLQDNFPDDKTRICHHTLREWIPSDCDVGLVDGDHFTLRLLPEWETILKNFSATCKYMIVADGACYGFKFGNLKHYGVSTPEEYYYLLDEALYGITKKHITHISKFENAACILLSSERPNTIRWLNPSNLIISRGAQTYKVQSSHKQGKLL